MRSLLRLVLVASAVGALVFLYNSPRGRAVVGDSARSARSAIRAARSVSWEPLWSSRESDGADAAMQAKIDETRQRVQAFLDRRQQQ